MFGRILNSLNYRLKLEDAEWLSANKTRKNIAYSRTHKLIINISASPFTYALRFFLIYCLITSLIGKYSNVFDVDYIFDVDIENNIQSHLYTIWPIQAAIAGVIYPIVIGFISIILQKQNADKVLLRIYLRDSAGKLAGLMSLFLILGMTIQYLFVPLANKNIIYIWSLNNALFFSINIMMTIWFLYRTFLFIRPDYRKNIIEKFCVNILLPYEVSKSLRNVLLHNPENNNLLPAKAYGKSYSHDNVSVEHFNYGYDTIHNEVVKKHAYEKELSDVYFRILSPAVLIWLSKATHHVENIDDTTKCKLIFNPSLNQIMVEDEVVCMSSGPVQNGSYENFLIRLAFRYKKRKIEKDLSVIDILKHIESEAKYFISKADEASFENSIRDLISMQVLLVRASEYINFDQKPDNFLNLNDSFFIYKSFYFEWSRVYLSLYDEAINKTNKSTSYVIRLMSIPVNIISEINNPNNIDICCHTINLFSWQYRKLSEWWEKEAESSGFYNHSPCQATVLKPPQSNFHETIMNNFIGKWSHLKNYYLSVRNIKKFDDWSEVQTYASLYIKHLEVTFYMLFRAVHAGDKSSSTWIADSLQIWWEELRYEFDNNHYYLRDTYELTIESLQKDWVLVQEKIPDSLHLSGEQIPPLNLFGAILKNYWIDITALTIYLLVDWGKDCDCENSMPAYLLKPLINNTRIKPEAGGSLGYNLRTNVNDVLISIIRQYYVDGGYEIGYRKKLDSLISNVFEYKKPDMVSGRTYSGWGVDDLRDTTYGQIFLLLIKSVENYTVSPDIDRIIRNWSINDDSLTREFKELLISWKDTIDTKEFHKLHSLYEYIYEDKNLNDFEVARKNTITLFEAIIDEIDNIRNEVISTSNIDPERLRSLAVWGSRNIFRLENSEFPINQFNNISYVDEADSQKSLRFTNCNKGEFTTPLFANLAVNEDEYYENILGNHVASSILAESLKILKPKDVTADNEASYLKILLDNSENIIKSDRIPILLLDNRTRPEWIWDWFNNRLFDDNNIPSGIHIIEKENNKSAGYVGNINDIEVYNAPLPPGASYLMSKESFNNIEFKRYAEDVYVDVFHEDIDDEESLINIIFEWNFNLNVELFPVIKLIYK